MLLRRALADPRLRQQAEIKPLGARVACLGEELAILRARFARLPAMVFQPIADPFWPLPEALTALAPLFELSNDGPAFMQDLDLAEGDERPIESLLIEAPGGNTLKNNADFFVKRERFDWICPACTAQALYVLQTNAPSGGQGHRTGLRGGGPLTTLLLPDPSGRALLGRYGRGFSCLRAGRRPESPGPLYRLQPIQTRWRDTQAGRRR